MLVLTVFIGSHLLCLFWLIIFFLNKMTVITKITATAGSAIPSPIANELISFAPVSLCAVMSLCISVKSKNIKKL